jgi:hypothetical protein
MSSACAPETSMPSDKPTPAAHVVRMARTPLRCRSANARDPFTSVLQSLISADSHDDEQKVKRWRGMVGTAPLAYPTLTEMSTASTGWASPEDGEMLS